jgi:rhodanese-related sulfurtransferase
MQKRKTAIGVILVAILLSTFLLIRPVAAEESGYRNISVQQAQRMINHNSRNLVILDVRNQSEYDVGHLYDATLIPVFLLENRTIQIQDHIDDKIIVYCKAGARSTEACEILVEQGFTKVYNMIGGINAWMEADYPIYTSYHHVTVDFAHHAKKTLIDIEPWLLYQDSCTSCQSQNQACSGSNTPANGNVTVLEESENHMVILVAEEVNDTVVEYTVDKTLLWTHNEFEGGVNRTMTFISTIITTDDDSTHLFGLNDYVHHEDYNITLSTILNPLNSETYNNSITTMEYVPNGEKEITTAELVDFNAPVTLSQLYRSVGEVAKQLGKNYAISRDENLRVFAERYYTMAAEAKLLSNW